MDGLSRDEAKKLVTTMANSINATIGNVTYTAVGENNAIMNVHLFVKPKVSIEHIDVKMIIGGKALR